MATPMSGDFATQAAASSSAKGPIRLMAESYARAGKSGTRSRSPAKGAGISASGRQLPSLLVPIPLHQRPMRDSVQGRLDLDAVWAALERRRRCQLLHD